MLSFLCITFCVAILFTTPPIPSTRPFPCDVAKGLQHIFSLCFSCNHGIEAAMNLFLNWLLGSSYQICNLFTLSSMTLLSNLSTKMIRESLERLRSSEIITAEVNESCCHVTDGNVVTCFLFQWADWTSSCQCVEKFSTKSIWRTAKSELLWTFIVWSS